jgi:hypothetical protein
MIAFQGGYLNTQDPAEAAFVRATDYYKRGMIVEQLDSLAAPSVPPVPKKTLVIRPTPSTIRTPASSFTSSTLPVLPKRPAPKHDRAAAWLKMMLRDGHPLPASWMLQQTLLAHISLRTLRRARMTVRVATKEGMTGGWAWTLPPDSDGLLR